jgi:SPP1 family predicted phage head-tail adaptor
MPISAGKLRHRVVIERISRAQDPNTGAITETWESVKEVWAAIEPLSAREFVQSAAAQSQVTARITMRKTDVLPTDRINHNGTIYNIAGVLPDLDSGREYLTLPVSTGVNLG